MEHWTPNEEIAAGEKIVARLTKKDRKALSLITLSNCEIAYRLGITESAVRARHQRLCEILSCANKSELTAAAIWLGIRLELRPALEASTARIGAFRMSKELEDFQQSKGEDK